MLADRSLQAQIPHNHCFGCGPANTAGLNLESFWTGEGPSVARFAPQPHHCAAPKHFVNGGILATLIDCHCICTAIAAAYRAQGRAIGSQPNINLVTAGMTLRYRRPAPIDSPLHLAAQIDAQIHNGYRVSCTLSARGKVCVTADVDAIQVADAWMQQQQ